MKYQIPHDQNEFLPNQLGLNSAEAIALAEFDGFLKAEIILTDELTNRTRFSSGYKQKVHKLALGEVYSFAGKGGMSIYQKADLFSRWLSFYQP
ncbi:hypothetical protein GCM10028808_31750 [Spirosoma migulaei]